MVAAIPDSRASATAVEVIAEFPIHSPPLTLIVKKMASLGFRLLNNYNTLFPCIVSNPFITNIVNKLLKTYLKTC